MAPFVVGARTLLAHCFEFGDSLSRCSQISKEAAFTRFRGAATGEGLARHGFVSSGLGAKFAVGERFPLKLVSQFGELVS